MQNIILSHFSHNLFLLAGFHHQLL